MYKAVVLLAVSTSAMLDLCTEGSSRVEEIEKNVQERICGSKRVEEVNVVGESCVVRIFIIWSIRQLYGDGINDHQINCLKA
jgi:hypothetical protein